MYKDPTEFRARFKAYREGKMPYENGLPKFAGGTPGQVNPYTLPLLQEFEGFKDTVYLDGKGIPTIGWGFTDSSLVNKGRISRKEADAELQRLAGNVESDLISKLGIDNWKQMSPESQAALISYAYNYPAGFKDTTNFMKLWRAGKYWDAIDEVDAGMHDKANPGLKKRRLKEQSYLRKDPFFLATSSAPTKKTDAELKIPIINKTDATTVNKVVPQEQTHARWEGAENVSPYLTGKPTLKLIPKTTLPSPTNLPDPYEGWFERRQKSKKMLDNAFSQYLFNDEDVDDLLYARNGKLPSVIPTYKDGKSPIHIKPANRGKLTRLKARTGKSESELYNDGNPAHKKMVVFARNARKWSH